MNFYVKKQCFFDTGQVVPGHAPIRALLIVNNFYEHDDQIQVPYKVSLTIIVFVTYLITMTAKRHNK